MFDFVTLVVTFPSIVEGIVKTCRTVQDYRHLQQSHTLTVQRAVFGCRKLAYYVSFVDVESHGTESTLQGTLRRDLLEDAVLHGYDAIVTMALVVEDWSVRLHMQTERSGRIIMAKIATNVAERLMRKHKTVELSRFGQSRFGRVASEAAYLAMGCRQINDAIEALDRWSRDLKDLLLSVPDLKNVRDPIVHVDITSMTDVIDDCLFVAQHRRRAKENVPVKHIDASEICSYRDIDPTHPTGFFTIETGRYMGCIIDRRDVNHLIADEMGDQAVQQTDNIARLFAEERSGSTAIAPFASLGVLPCCGWAQVSSRFLSTEHDLVFRPPPGTRRPRTLRMLLLEGAPRHSLNERLRFAIELANSILLVHSLNLVHKDIRPDSILVFEPLRAKETDLFPYKLGTPYLSGFGRARDDSSDTTITPFKYSAYMRVTYTHPRHTTTSEHMRYRMRDDIYSLGVVLIEVALWKSLFAWMERRECYDADFSWFDFSIEKYKKIFIEMEQPEYRDRGWLMRWDLIQLAEREIPIIMGDKFKDVVVSCLTFGEESTPNFSESVMKIMEVEYTAREESVKFVKNILTELRSLSFS